MFCIVFYKSDYNFFLVFCNCFFVIVRVASLSSRSRASAIAMLFLVVLICGICILDLFVGCIDICLSFLGSI